LRRVVGGQEQTQLGDDDCPYHAEGGDHDCEGIHKHEHVVPKCAESATLKLADEKKGGNSGGGGGDENTASFAIRAGFPVVVLIAVMTSLRLIA